MAILTWPQQSKNIRSLNDKSLLKKHHSKLSLIKYLNLDKVLMYEQPTKSHLITNKQHY